MRYSKITGDALRAIRVEAGLSRDEMAHAIGRSAGYLANVEGGHNTASSSFLHDYLGAAGKPGEDFVEAVCWALLQNWERYQEGGEDG